MLGRLGIENNRRESQRATSAGDEAYEKSRLWVGQPCYLLYVWRLNGVCC